MAGKRVQLEVRVGALYVDGVSYPEGAIVQLSAADAKVLQGRGEVGKPGSLKREAEQAAAEAQAEAEARAESRRSRSARSRRARGSGSSEVSPPTGDARAVEPARSPAPDADPLAGFGSTA